MTSPHASKTHEFRGYYTQRDQSQAAFWKNSLPEFGYFFLQKINMGTPNRGVPRPQTALDYTLRQQLDPMCVYVACGGAGGEGCSVNVCGMNGQHILAKVDSLPHP